MSTDPDPSDFVDAMAPALRQAAAIARALEGRVQNNPKSEESTAVKAALTMADTASQEAVLVALHERFPHVQLEAEEDTPSVRRFPSQAGSRVVVDPIDGTLHFYLGGEGPYASMVGLVTGGRFTAGLVALPREGLFFDAARGRGARGARAGAALRPPRLESEGSRVLVSHKTPPAVLDHLRSVGLDPLPASGGAIAVAPLIRGVRAGLRIQRGPLGVSIRGRVAAFVAAEAGCRVFGGDGEPFPFEVEAPCPVLISAANDEDVALVRDALAAADLA